MEEKKLTAANGRPIADNQNTQTAGQRGPVMMQDPWFLEKLAHFDREVIPERRMHAKGSGAYGTFTVTHDITKYTRAAIFSEVGKQTECFVRFSTVAASDTFRYFPSLTLTDTVPEISSAVLSQIQIFYPMVCCLDLPSFFPES